MKLFKFFEKPSWSVFGTNCVIQKFDFDLLLRLFDEYVHNLFPNFVIGKDVVFDRPLREQRVPEEIHQADDGAEAVQKPVGKGMHLFPDHACLFFLPFSRTRISSSVMEAQLFT